jgi:trimeric autotransporter adhesin
MSLAARPIALLVALITLAACSGGGDAAPTTPTTPPPPTAVASVSVALGSPQLVVGGNTIATAETRSSTGASLTGRAVSWSSSNAAVASVSNTGAITALTPGTTTIVATSDGQSGSAVLTVLPVPVATVTVTLAQATLTAGSSTVAIVTLRSATNEVLTERPITWSSSDNAIATVSQSGTVSSVAPGTATITAQSGGQSGSAVLTVMPVPVASVAVVLAPAIATVGETVSATATLRSASNQVLTGRVVSWSTSNPSVATVSASGVITTLVPGTTTVQATSEGQSGSAVLTVTAVPVATVTVALGQPTLTAGATTSASATLRGATGQLLSGRTINWASSNTAVATINATGAITAIAPGTVTISATSEGRTGSAVLTVTPPPVALVNVSLGAQSLQVGQTTTASAVARDAAGNVLTGRPVNWSSTTPSVASVNGAGVVTALAPGTTVISASIDGRVGTAALQVSTIGVASVTLSPSAITMVAGDLRLVVATVRDAAGNPLLGRQVNWFTSDNTVVDGAVSGDTALITGLRAGSVTLSVQVEGRTASIPVTVQVPTTNICSLIAGASIVGNDGRYLGRFSNRFDAESVLNEFGIYGSRFASNSTNNEFGTYGSRFSTLSARNPFTSTPPRIIRNGSFIAFYTVNEFLTPRVAPAFALTCTFP